MIRTQHFELQLQKTPYALARALRIILIFAGHEGQVPAQDILEAFCNLGYASSCAWAPEQRAWDAVRLSVSTPEDGGNHKGSSTPARVLRLLYVCERDHRPVSHGDLLIDLSTTIWLRRHEDPRIQKMAECFLDSYLKKKG